MSPPLGDACRADNATSSGSAPGRTGNDVLPGEPDQPRPHGTAQLFLAPPDQPPRALMTPEDLLESATGIYLRGLGIIPGDG